jgi:hypothetical protein
MSASMQPPTDEALTRVNTSRMGVEVGQTILEDLKRVVTCILGQPQVPEWRNYRRCNLQENHCACKLHAKLRSVGG